MKSKPPSASPTVSDRDLGRYFDGDLPAKERSRVEALLATDETTRRRLTTLQQVRALLRESIERSTAATTINVWPGVRQAIAKPPSLAERFGEWLRGRWAVPIVAGAAAMGVVVVVSIATMQSMRTQEDRAGAVAGRPVKKLEPVMVASLEPSIEPSVQIEAIETDGPPPIVMAAVWSDATSIPVVWLEDR